MPRTLATLDLLDELTNEWGRLPGASCDDQITQLDCCLKPDSGAFRFAFLMGELATEEKMILAFEPTSRMVLTTITRMTASITA